jgi:hypothetical protein
MLFFFINLANFVIGNFSFQGIYIFNGVILAYFGIHFEWFFNGGVFIRAKDVGRFFVGVCWRGRLRTTRVGRLCQSSFM